MKLLTIFIVTCLYWQMADSCPDQGDLPEECLDCRLVRVACTNQLRNARCRPRCNSQEVCCENCCGGQSCVAKNSGNNDDGSNGDQNDCDFACTDEYRPICGSDGRTYGNGCELRAAMCRNPGLTVQQKGACPPDVKDGTCPPRQLRSCILGGPDDVPGCESDADCKGRQKCCPGVCTSICQDPVEDVPACPDGSDPVNCVVSPCEFATCEAYPDAICEDNYCGGCNTDWYVDGELVDCEVKDGTCPPRQLRSCILGGPDEVPGCESDADCKERQKCCPGVCTSICQDPVEDVCSLPIVLGPCRGSFPRWGYRNGRCEEFIYGGCQGNANSFLTEADCVTACSGQNVCSLPIVPGPCKGAFPRWGYRNGRCEEFIYGGCQGNANNFLTEADCVAACSGQNVCQLPLVTGPCEAFIHRWGFRNDECVGFIYGGCEGNANNFESLADCIDACGPN